MIIQTAFIGDVILATSLVETLNKHKGDQIELDILVRKGNEVLLQGQPGINKVLIWNKKEGKYRQLRKLAKTIRKSQYDRVINLQRFGSTGWLTWRSGGKNKIGFRKNPFAFCYDEKHPHEVGDGTHEIVRNFQLIRSVLPTIEAPEKPKLYPPLAAVEKVHDLIEELDDFYVLAPSSVWFTKQLPFEKWQELIDVFSQHQHHQPTILLIGAPDDFDYLERLKKSVKNKGVINLAGQLNLLESAALISRAKRTFVNDSAPLHLASAMNAPVTAFFCSTVPDFGFGPLSDDQQLVENANNLNCRPCGLHGHKTCPKGHFKCGLDIVLNHVKR